MENFYSCDFIEGLGLLTFWTHYLSLDSVSQAYGGYCDLILYEGLGGEEGGAHVGSQLKFHQLIGCQWYFSPYVASRLTPFRP